MNHSFLRGEKIFYTSFPNSSIFLIYVETLPLFSNLDQVLPSQNFLLQYISKFLQRIIVPLNNQQNQ